MIQLQAIKEASEQLHTAWVHYLRVCSDIDNTSWQRETYYNLSRGFLQHIDDELARFSCYEENAQRAQCTLKRALQRASYLAPIHSLPSEILLRIFYVSLVGPCVPNQPFGWYNNGHLLPRNQQPDPIAQVCSRWRNIVTLCPLLWTHVDIPLTSRSCPRLLDRAKLYVQRSANLPLELHIYSAWYENSQTGYAPLIPFLKTVASRAKTLIFSINDYDSQPFCSSILDAFLSNCSTELFNRLVARSNISTPPYLLSQFKDFDEDEDDDNSSNEDSPIEEYFSGLSALDLKGCYPYWSSSAFHGLVDLRLAPSPNYRIKNPTLHPSELIGILTASPGLRIFYFSLDVSDVETVDPATLPVPLKDLEVVNLSTEERGYSTQSHKVGSVLRLLAPGSKALRLTLDCKANSNELLDSADELHEFLMRSKVEKLCLRHAKHFSEQMLLHTPDVKVLILEECDRAKFNGVAVQAHDSNALNDSGHSTGFNFNESDNDASFMLPRLQSCYILTTSIMDTMLHTLARLCPTGLLVDLDELEEVFTGLGTCIPFEEIPNHFPTVKFLFLPSVSKLTADWDVLD